MAELPPTGSTVLLRLRTWSGEIEEQGIIMPPAAANHVTMKLVNGYNISHPSEAILGCEVLAKPESATTPSSSGKPAKQKEDLPRVRIIHTGGTIASKVDYATGAVVARFEPEELLASIPELSEVARIDAVKIGNMWSDDMRPQHWNTIAKASADAFADGVAGVVVTHGTDTLAISACALSFSWAGVGSCPPGRIVFTGSQRSSDRGSSDANENLLASVYWAANGPSPNGGLGDSTVVMLHSSADDGEIAVLPGCSARKLHSTRRDAFQAINSTPLGHVHLTRGGISHTLSDEYANALANTPSRGQAPPTEFSENIRIGQLISGAHLHADMVNATAAAGYSALVIHGTGLGHLPIENPNANAPENEELGQAIGAVIKGGMPVVIANQCIHGPVNMNVYSKGRIQQELGILGQANNSSPEAVIVKCHWSLSQGRNLSQDMMQNLVGENPSSIKD